MIYTAGIIVIK